ncbi:VCBS repeat-containing protein [Candidatus Pacearchaeota archaeon]|nr:VCBS repeat-containing protein [Candidatus Pacearchaeota archaeon]
MNLISKIKEKFVNYRNIVLAAGMLLALNSTPALTNSQAENIKLNLEAKTSVVQATSIPYQQGWPVQTGGEINSSPALADLDGDGKLEVIIGSDDGKVYAWHHDGSLVDGWPQQTNGWVRSSPAVADLDGDGDTEIIVGSGDGKVYAWDLPGKFDASKVPWKMFRRDLQHTGSYHTFDDILTNYWSYHEIEAIYRAGITKGCVANNKEFIYCPSSQVRRDEMAAFLQRALGLPTTPSPFTIPYFGDVPRDYWAFKEIQAICKAGITKGCVSDDPSTRWKNEAKYCPENNVRRDEMAAFLQRAKGLPLYAGSQIFNDIPLDYWSFGEIGAIYQEGITKGCLENPLRYCPGSNVRRDEMAAFLFRAFLK